MYWGGEQKHFHTLEHHKYKDIPEQTLQHLTQTIFFSFCTALEQYISNFCTHKSFVCVTTAAPCVIYNSDMYNTENISPTYSFSHEFLTMFMLENVRFSLPKFLNNASRFLPLSVNRLMHITALVQTVSLQYVQLMAVLKPPLLSVKIFGIKMLWKYKYWLHSSFKHNQTNLDSGFLLIRE